jgi:hypothetical protein
MPILSCGTGVFLSDLSLCDLTIIFVIVIPSILILILIWEATRHE